MLLNLVYMILWILVAVALGAVLAVFVQLRLGCTYAESIDHSSSGFMNSTCLPAGGKYCYTVAMHDGSLLQIMALVQ